MSVIWMEPDALNSELRVLREGCAMGETAGMQSRTGGRLRGMPYRRPHRTWAGQGTGVVCDLCSNPIQSHEIEYEIELSVDRLQRVLYLHVQCFREWATQSGR